MMGSGDASAWLKDITTARENSIVFDPKRRIQSHMSRLFHDPSRRHPRCPQCHYNLVATIAANKRMCPECGRRFTMSELARAPRAGDWTPVQGLARASGALLIRSIIVLPFWAGFIWLVTPLLNLFPFPGFWMGGLIGRALIIIIPACVLGHVLSRKLNDKAGMQSVIITGLALVFAIAVIAGGIELAVFFRTGLTAKGFISMCASGALGIFIVRNTLFET